MSGETSDVREPEPGEVFTWRPSRRQFVGAVSALAGAATLSGLAGSRGEVSAAAPASTGSVGAKEVFTLCEMCVWRCGVVAKVKDGRVVKLEGNPNHPHSRGVLCPRGQAGLALTYDPDRLKYPMMRVGERGSGRWRRVTWDEALQFVADQMQSIKQNFGPQAMIFSSTHNLVQTQFENLLTAFGSPNYGTQRSLCFNSMIVSNLFTFGIEEPARDYQDVRFILYTGRNLLEAISNSETQDLVAAVARGATVIVCDPRFTKTAAKAREWLPIRPGGDLALLLAMAQVIITERRYDAEFVQNHTVGFDDFAATVGQYTPEWAGARCDIPADTIRRLAREMANAAPHAFVHPNWRTSNFVNSFQAERMIAVLNALLGNWNAPGGLCESAGGEAEGLGGIPQPAYPPVTAQRLDGVPWKYPLVPLKLGVFQALRDAILTGQPYQARGWFVYRQNPAQSLPDRAKTLAAFNKVDLLVTIDVTMNDTAWYADVVLPEASYLERYDPLAVLDNKAFIRQPAVPALYESRSGLWMFRELGWRLGLGAFFNYADEEEYLRAQLAPLNVSLDEVKAKGFTPIPAAEQAPDPSVPVFNTPSGKIEIASSALKAGKFSPLPQWEEPPAPAAGQFFLLTGKVAQHTQSGTQNNVLLHDLYPENVLWIHSREAAKRGIAHGDNVLVESEVGKLVIQAHVTEGIRPDCVWTSQGFGHRSKALRTAFGAGGCDSDLHVTYTDPVSGGQALSQTFVRVSRA
jgi:thiosulfate reductase/polysulfide reductase chain A